MTKNEDEAAKRPSKLRRVLKILVILVLVAGGLYVVRLGIGLGTAAIHYSRTPDFANYIASHPVDAGVIEQRLPPGAPIAKSLPWTTGPVDPLGLKPGKGELERGGMALIIDITHGDESLLSLRQEFSVALRRSDWTHHGVHITAPTVRTKSGLRAIVVTSISDPEKMVGEDSEAVGGAVVDVFLVSGEGPPETRFQLYPEGSIWSGGPGQASQGFSFPFWRMVSGITHNVKALPDEGLIHHIRHRVAFDWDKHENGSGGPSFSQVYHNVNTEEYSHDVKIQIEQSMDGRDTGGVKSTKSLRRTWNGEVW